MDKIDQLKHIWDQVNALSEPDKAPPFEECVKFIDQILDLMEGEIPKPTYENYWFWNKINVPYDRLTAIKWIFTVAVKPKPGPFETKCDDGWHAVTFSNHKRELLNVIKELAYTLAQKWDLIALRQ